MPTKQEMLEEKTVKELTQMAREKDLSGYSKMNKADLVELIKSNYMKAEIEAWPEVKEDEEEEAEEKKKESEEKEETAEEEIEEVEEKEPETPVLDESELKKPKRVETVEIEGDFEQIARPPKPKRNEKDMTQWLLIGAIIIVIIIGAALIYWAI